MTEPSALALDFKIFQKVELINLCSERLNFWLERTTGRIYDLKITKGHTQIKIIAIFFQYFFRDLTLQRISNLVINLNAGIQ